MSDVKSEAEGRLSIWELDTVSYRRAVIIAAVLFVSAFAFQFVVPTLNHDDIVQLQDNDYALMIGHGRWGYATVHYFLLGGNQTPIVSAMIGVVCLLAATHYQIRLIGLEHNLSKLIFLTLAIVTVYYQYLFSFDSVRIAYMLSNLFMAWGLYASVEAQRPGTRMLGVLAISLAPTFYTAAIMFGSTTIAAAALLTLLRSDVRVTVVRAIRLGVALALGLLLYVVIIKILYAATGWTLEGRTDVDVTDLKTNLWYTRELVSAHLFPFLSGNFGFYLDLKFHLIGKCLLLLFLSVVVVRGIRHKLYFRTFMALVGFGVLLIGPYWPMLISSTSFYPERALYSFAIVYAFCAAASIEVLKNDDEAGAALALKTLAAKSVVIFAFAFAALNVLIISQRSYDEYLAYESDKALLVRMLTRIDDQIGGQFRPAIVTDGIELVPPQPVPIAVFGATNWSRSGPRGEVESATSPYWATAYAFRFLDNRFVPATEAQRQSVAESTRGRGAWPAADSVYLIDGVVVINRAINVESGLGISREDYEEYIGSSESVLPQKN